MVGANNSGCEIALEMASGHPTWMSGRHPGHVPFRIENVRGRYLGIPLVIGLIFHHVLSLGTPIGRKVRPKLLHKAGVVVRSSPKTSPPQGSNASPGP